jgi:hypothetical protein
MTPETRAKKDKCTLAVYADGDKLRILGASDDPLIIFKGAGLRIACRWKTGARYSEGCHSRKPTLSAGPPRRFWQQRRLRGIGMTREKAITAATAVLWGDTGGLRRRGQAAHFRGAGRPPHHFEGAGLRATCRRRTGARGPEGRAALGPKPSRSRSRRAG